MPPPWPTLKQGAHSVGVAHQYCGAEGKSANCQVNVQVAVTDGEGSIPVAARLYLPEKWTSDPERCRAAGVPPQVVFLTKPEIALELITEALRDGVERGRRDQRMSLRIPRYPDRPRAAGVLGHER